MGLGSSGSVEIYNWVFLGIISKYFRVFLGISGYIWNHLFFLELVSQISILLKKLLRVFLQVAANHYPWLSWYYTWNTQSKKTSFSFSLLSTLCAKHARDVNDRQSPKVQFVCKIDFFLFSALSFLMSRKWLGPTVPKFDCFVIF